MASCFSSSRFARTPIAAAALLLTVAAHSQTTTTTLSPVTVTGRGDPAIDVSGWVDVPLSKAPFQASIVSREQMRELGVQRLADVVRIDPSVSDAYNAEGYWDYLTVRGERFRRTSLGVLNVTSRSTEKVPLNLTEVSLGRAKSTFVRTRLTSKSPVGDSR